MFTDRPSLVDAGYPGAARTSYGFFNLNPAPGEPVIPRNFGVGPTQFTFDVTATKMFAEYKGMTPSARRATVALSITNLLNHTNYAPFNGVLTSPFFGTANRGLNKRRVTFSPRYDFNPSIH